RLYTFFFSNLTFITKTSKSTCPILDKTFRPTNFLHTDALPNLQNLNLLKTQHWSLPKILYPAPLQNYPPRSYPTPPPLCSLKNFPIHPVRSPTRVAVPKPDEQSTTELVLLLLAAQHASSVQSLADRQALAADRRATQDRLAQFEQAILRLSVKPEPPAPSPQPSDGGIDLQHFSVEPFLNWIKQLEVFFETKG
ncbi:hypothetical protein VP01_9710g1, partial [Puccinia sorghi]